MTKRLLKIILALFLLLLAATVPFFIYVTTPVTPREFLLSIEKGMTLKQITAKLETQGILQHPWLFLTYAHLLRKEGKLKAGEYFFDKPVSPHEVLDILVEGKVYALKVQLIEGWTLDQIADYLESIPFKEPNFKEEFLRLARDKTLEGYLFPNTYYLSPNIKILDMLGTLVKEFEKKYQEAMTDLKGITPLFSKHQIITLASLIEKETGLESERPLISSVFYNRLAKKMPLASDPTVIYGLKNFSGDIRNVDLKNPHPYNTYVHSGLPPGPICNPGLNSIKAALYPAATDFLYFVSKKDGTHHFSKTAEEHAKAVQKFQLGKGE